MAMPRPTLAPTATARPTHTARALARHTPTGPRPHTYLAHHSSPHGTHDIMAHETLGTQLQGVDRSDYSKKTTWAQSTRLTALVLLLLFSPLNSDASPHRARPKHTDSPPLSHQSLPVQHLNPPQHTTHAQSTDLTTLTRTMPWNPLDSNGTTRSSPTSPDPDSPTSTSVQHDMDQSHMMMPG